MFDYKNGLNCVLMVSFLVLSCGSDNSDLSASRQTSEDTRTEIRSKGPTTYTSERTRIGLPSIEREPASDTPGLLFTVANNLVHQKPGLSAEVCNHVADKRVDHHVQCYVMSDKELISFGSKRLFYLPTDKLKSLLSRSDSSSLEFRFNDNYSKSYIHWPCADHRKMEIANYNDRELYKYDIKVTQINTVSYSCHISGP